MMIGRLLIDTKMRRGAGTSWAMGWLRAGALVEWTITKNGWLNVGKSQWIPASAVVVVVETPDPPPVRPPSADGTIQMIRFHCDMPVEEQNRGSFGIVRVYAHPKADKPHSIFPSGAFIESVKFINTARAFSWLYEHDDNRFFGAHYDDGSGYRIPTQGVFMGNLVRVLERHNNFSRLDGITGAIPAGMTHLTHPEYIHFCWCVDRSGRTIPPPGGTAYHPVLNPVHMKGANVGGELQTEIWIENKWLEDVAA